MKNLCLSAATMGLSLACASHADAGFTYFKINTNEPTVADILDRELGGEFRQEGVDFVSGNTIVKRVDDDSDQRWTGTFAIKTVGRFSGYTQELGTNPNGPFQSLVQAEGLGFESTSDERVVTLDDQGFIRTGDSGTQSSIPEDNDDARDHLITYRLNDDAHAPVWLLFWEDLNTGPKVTKGRSSSDFNDLVVMVRSVSGESPAPIAVPLPPAFWVGAATLGLSAYLMRKRLA